MDSQLYIVVGTSSICGDDGKLLDMDEEALLHMYYRVKAPNRTDLNKTDIMKLLVCTECSDIFNLTREQKICGCGKSSGRYVDDLNAVYSGPAQPLGFANDSFIASLKMQRIEDKHQKTETTCEGVDFTAFFIHNCASTIKKQ